MRHIYNINFFTMTLFMFIINTSILINNVNKSFIQGLEKVIVPAIYKEWVHKKPWWANITMQAKYNYSIFVYQKLNSSEPNYFQYNRGAECGTYLKYIVDHYDNFPDIAIFVHAKPHEHSKNWMHLVNCISENATFMNINNDNWITRSPSYWKGIEIWQEQCWRDTLQTTWDLLDNITEFHQRLPPSKDIWMSAQCCNQFLISRDVIRRRPLHVWKRLLDIIGIQDACHLGKPDYSNLFHYKYNGQVKVGPEPQYVTQYGEHPINNHGYSPGRIIQACTLEHLSHVVFGHLPLDSPLPNKHTYCQNFIKGCPGSPCK